MPIGPSGERLPYPGEPGARAVGNGSRVDQAMAQSGPLQSPANQRNGGGGNEMAAKNRLMEIAAEAEAIMTQFPHLAQELAGGGQNAQPATPVPQMPQMPVEGNTGGMGGLLAGGPQYG